MSCSGLTLSPPRDAGPVLAPHRHALASPEGHTLLPPAQPDGTPVAAGQHHLRANTLRARAQPKQGSPNLWGWGRMILMYNQHWAIGSFLPA